MKHALDLLRVLTVIWAMEFDFDDTSGDMKFEDLLLQGLGCGLFVLHLKKKLSQNGTWSALSRTDSESRRS